MSDVPTLKDEIERKALTTLEKICLDQHNGRITEAQYAYGLDVLWSAVAGLAGADFTTVMSIAKDGRKDASRYTRAYFRARSGAIAKLTNLHDGRVMLDTIAPDGLSRTSKTFDFQNEIGSLKVAQDRFLQLEDVLFNKGFEPI